MKRALVILIGLTVAAGCSKTPAPPPPRLVVVLIVDQMRADYLDRFAGSLHGGLRRLIDEGVSFGHCNFGHAMTGTAPGHASLSTGCDPRLHGVFEQVWYDRDLRSEIPFTGDPRHALVGGGGEGVSPHRMWRDTLGDWLKTSSPSSKVYAVAIKSRAAVALGGHRADGVYWYDPDLPGAISSTYYMQELPAWVTEFNALGLLAHFQAEGWSPLVPESIDDAGRKNRLAAGSGAPYGSFPHRFDQGIAHQIRSSPHGDDLTLQFAERLLLEEDLGQDAVSDLLWVGLSAADYIGHLYGPFSLEVQDHVLRLDLYLQRFFETLDRLVGAGQYVVALGSDHGVAPIPEHEAQQGVDAQRVTLEDYLASVRDVAEKTRQELDLPSSPLLHANADGIWLDLDAGGAAGVPTDRLLSTFSRRLRELTFVKEVMGPEQLQGPRPAGGHAEAYWRSYVPGRGPDLMILSHESWLVATYPAGTNHGTPYPYDTHVPFILWGPRFPARRVEAVIEPIDLAPTLAEVLQVRLPGEVQGRSRLSMARTGK